MKLASRFTVINSSLFGCKLPVCSGQAARDLQLAAVQLTAHGVTTKPPHSLSQSTARIYNDTKC